MTVTDEDENNETHYFLNGAEISETDWNAGQITPTSNAVYLLASTDYAAAVVGLDYDNAMQYLFDQTNEQQATNTEVKELQEAIDLSTGNNLGLVEYFESMGLPI